MKIYFFILFPYLAYLLVNNIFMTFIYFDAWDTTKEEEMNY